MSIRAIYKDIELNGRKWRIGKFDALTGSYIVYKMMTQLLPMGMDAKVVGEERTNLPAMSRVDFSEIQTECLRVCSEVQNVGNVETFLPVLMANGSWGVADINDDVMTVMALTVHALAHNASGFFGEGALKGLSATFKDLNP